MNAENFHELLKNHDACPPAIEWAAGKSWQEVYDTCHRGDWLIWLFVHTNPDDIRIRVLVAGHCANAVRHLMTDERSIKAVDTAIAFGEGKIGINELKEAAADAAYAADADADAYAAYAAADAADAAADAAYAADAAVYAAADAYAAAQQLTANIVRKCIPIEKYNIQ